ncbi:hypothetical protein CS542_03430 [Pedobacter sp. IW39]|nr:hypothetical protein CS542_03430 [Pedobacter sp. IW39]
MQPGIFKCGTSEYRSKYTNYRSYLCYAGFNNDQSTVGYHSITNACSCAYNVNYTILLLLAGKVAGTYATNVVYSYTTLIGLMRILTGLFILCLAMTLPDPAKGQGFSIHLPGFS